jgi:DNA-binding NtrC family response regulator
VTTVAVINTSADTVEALRMFLEQHGFETVTVHVDELKRGRIDALRFLAEHDPRALVYDVSPPYDDNWNFLKLFRSSEAMRGRAVVVTTTHKANLEQLVGPTDAIEIIGKPYDLDQVVAAVKRAVDGA